MLRHQSFGFYFKFFVGPRSILGATHCPLFWTLCDPHHGFQGQGGFLACTLTCLHAVNLRVTSGATSAFSTHRGVHCISMYTTGLPSRLPTCKQLEVGYYFPGEYVLAVTPDFPAYYLNTCRLCCSVIYVLKS